MRESRTGFREKAAPPPSFRENHRCPTAFFLSRAACKPKSMSETGRGIRTSAEAPARTPLPRTVIIHIRLVRVRTPDSQRSRLFHALTDPQK
jgi:hypothetical protein